MNQQWLSELDLLSGLAGARPDRADASLYAFLITAPLALLLWLCRRKGWPMLIAVTAFYFPGPARGDPSARRRLHRRDLLAAGRAARHALARARRAAAGAPTGWWAPVAIVVLFALWANLHGGFIAGLPAARAWRRSGSRSITGAGSRGSCRFPGSPCSACVGVLAAVTVTVSTPLGAAIWSYLLSFQNQAISLASTEWESAFSRPAGDPLPGAGDLSSRPGCGCARRGPAAPRPCS